MKLSNNNDSRSISFHEDQKKRVMKIATNQFCSELENSIQQGVIPAKGSVAPSLLEEWKLAKIYGKGRLETEEDKLLEEVTFDRCFYIYIGPEHMERSCQLDEKSAYNVKLKKVHQLLSLQTGSDGKNAKSETRKNVENLSYGSYDEIKSFHGSSVSKAA
ncbi:hypothetical protein Lser_V15G38515 [Lactuca serriola]